ncbi:MAG TPA: lytic transglycosylase domain-containing protein [Stellaceae bacterium]|nr:lytic transglycosylase domain-containing protein [Stellaceae bacterium]
MKLKFAFILLTALFLDCVTGAAARAASLTESDRRIYAEAYAAAKRGDWTRAYRLAATAHDPLPATALHWLQDKEPDSGASFGAITSFIEAHPDWPAQKVLLERAEEAIGTGTDSQVNAWFKLHPPRLPVARLRQAQIWMESGRKDEALALIRKAWIEGDFTAVEEKLMLQRYRGVLREEDNVRRLDRLLWDDQTKEAKRMLRHVSPDEAALGQARLALAEMSPGVEGLLARVPANLRSDPGLLYERLRWRRRNDLDNDAADILEHPPADLVRPEAWAAERLILARRVLDDGQNERAYRLAATHEVSSGATFAELEFLAGWIALRVLDRPQIAYNHFVRLYDAVKLPISIARGAYWAARAAEAMKETSLAEAWYSSAAPEMTTYYGQLAAAHLGAVGPATLFKEPTPTKAEVAAFERNELVQTVRDLAQIGDADDLAPFLRRLTAEQQTAAGFVQVARLAHAVDRPDMAVTAAKHASYAGVTLLDDGYPLAKLPPGGNIETPLVLAMTRQESAFDRGAVSGAGALGMMQLMPATASKIAKSLHIKFSRKRLTHDVAYNITLGRAYLDSLIDNFSGSYVLAVASYNAGPSRVHQWMRDHGDPRRSDVDMIDWIERIPLTETRNYVQRVLENLQIYRLRLDAHLPGFSLASDLKR